MNAELETLNSSVKVTIENKQTDSPKDREENMNAFQVNMG